MGLTKYRKCPHPECDTRISDMLAMCRQHWWGLGKPLRDEIIRSFYANGKGSAAHIEVIRSAVEEVYGG